jgi:hypothetical protein
MKKNLIPMALVAGLLLLAGCAKEPAEQISAANDSFQKANSPDVAEYSPDALNAAKDAKSKLDQELETQKKEWAMFRKYEHTTELANELKSSSEAAVKSAEVAKEKAKTDATTAVADARRSLDEARSMLTTAPVGKGTQADLALLKSDLDGVESSITDADSVLQSGRYKEALSKAQAAQQKAEDVKSQIVAAKEARTRPRPSKV